jgi:hypothetical protein
VILADTERLAGAAAMGIDEALGKVASTLPEGSAATSRRRSHLGLWMGLSSGAPFLGTPANSAPLRRGFFLCRVGDRADPRFDGWKYEGHAIELTNQDL